MFLININSFCNPAGDCPSWNHIILLAPGKNVIKSKRISTASTNSYL